METLQSNTTAGYPGRGLVFGHGFTLLVHLILKIMFGEGLSAFRWICKLIGGSLEYIRQSVAAKEGFQAPAHPDEHIAYAHRFLCTAPAPCMS